MQIRIGLATNPQLTKMKSVKRQMSNSFHIMELAPHPNPKKVSLGNPACSAEKEISVMDVLRWIWQSTTSIS